ncbi:MAG: VOC family protein [Alphaproteobacteria bacterium]
MSETPKYPKMTWAVLRSQLSGFSDKLNVALEMLGIFGACRDLQIDHICVRLKLSSDVDWLKSEIADAGQVISSVNVNGREITLLQLHQPLTVGEWEISGVELPYPKPRHPYEDGWEHVEFVLNGAENTLNGVRSAFMQKFPTLNADKLRTDYGYSEDVPHADGDQMPNPTLGLSVNGIGLKFHAKPIQVIVGYEK